MAYTQDILRGDFGPVPGLPSRELAFGVQAPVFQGDAIGQQVLGIMNARDAARQASMALSERVFGGEGERREEGRALGRGRGRGRGLGWRRRRDGEMPATPETPETSPIPTASPPVALPPMARAAAAPLPPGVRARVRPAVATIASGV
jgi:hypothetical protein